MPSPATRDCIVLFTHKWSPAIARHYARLQRQAGRVADVRLAMHQQEGVPLPEGMAPDVVVTWTDAARNFPRRAAQMEARKSPWGFIDLIWSTAFLDKSLAACDRFWLVEYDIDYSGDWADFFGATATYDADVLTAHLRPLSAEPNYFFAPLYRQPEASPADPLIALMSISRMSRRFLEHYRDTLRQPGWDGHFEMVLPSIARAGGFTVAEIGGENPFTPPERRGLHYTGSFADNDRPGTTHGYLPARGYRYFVDSPRRFRLPNSVYHPIKADFTLRRRLEDKYRPLSKWFRKYVPHRTKRPRRQRPVE